MEKSIFEQMGGTYRQEDDYLLPNLAPPESAPIGIWGQRRKYFLKTQREPIYTALLLSGKLDVHLADINRQAEEMFSRLVTQMAEGEEVTEQFKAENQMAWVGKMNSIHNRAEEIVFNEYILC